MTKGMVRDKVKAVDQIQSDPGLPMHMYPGFELGFDHWGTICPLG